MRRVSIHRLRRARTSFVVAALVVGCDLASKWWARANLTNADRHVVGPLWLRLSTNQGFSFSLSNTWPTFAAIAELVALLGVIVALWFAATTPAAIGFGLIMGGGVGNLADRLGSSSHGVTDFVAVGSLPVFNLADSAITVGVFVLAVLAVTNQAIWTRQ